MLPVCETAVESKLSNNPASSWCSLTSHTLRVECGDRHHCSSGTIDQLWIESAEGPGSFTCKHTTMKAIPRTREADGPQLTIPKRVEAGGGGTEHASLPICIGVTITIRVAETVVLCGHGRWHPLDAPYKFVTDASNEGYVCGKGST